MSAGRNKWQKTKNNYYKLYPANHQGYWVCSLCGGWTQNPDLDHIKPRGSHPQLIHELSNLRVVCRRCHIRRHE